MKLLVLEGTVQPRNVKREAFKHKNGFIILEDITRRGLIPNSKLAAPTPSHSRWFVGTGCAFRPCGQLLEIDRRTVDPSYPSRPTIADGHLPRFHNDGNLARTFRVLKHLAHSGSIFQHVAVLKRNSPFAVVLTGGGGIGSGVLPKDQHFLSTHYNLSDAIVSFQTDNEFAFLLSISA